MALPTAVEEKLQLQRRFQTSNSSWFRFRVRVRRSRLQFTIPLVAIISTAKIRRRHGLVSYFLVSLLLFLLSTFVLRILGNWVRHLGHRVQEPSTLVFEEEDLRRIWRWEIESGHYPSTQPLPLQLRFNETILNPALPPQPHVPKPGRFKQPSARGFVTEALGTGGLRTYANIHRKPPNIAYPQRPRPGAIADLDLLETRCGYLHGKYVRDCLEMLSAGAGLVNRNNLQHGTGNWSYMFVEDKEKQISRDRGEHEELEKKIRLPPALPRTTGRTSFNKYIVMKTGTGPEQALHLPNTLIPKPLSNACDPDNPRLFHMFWTGPLTDKPYMALLSFLFTQNLGLNFRVLPEDSQVCKPQLWIWINPGPAAALGQDVVVDLFGQLRGNPWASPFLHPKFQDVIQFKLWNTTEQLDGIPEIKDEWRQLRDVLFNSGGDIIRIQGQRSSRKKDDRINRIGSKSASSYDKMSVILSDMARFVLCHRFGGIYLDADTILLRDWEELWGWSGAFAYRWSLWDKYNTAVLKMSKNSALGTFLFRTAFRNGLDFHPMTVSRYLKDSFLERLLMRLPDALFDPAWLNAEGLQTDRPPHPFFTEFSEFFDSPPLSKATPQIIGFQGFFRGSYSYHYHNFWWEPSDPSRNFPDLGSRFKGELDQARAMAERTVAQRDDPLNTIKSGFNQGPFESGDDIIGLSWAAVLKRTFEAYIRGESPNMYGEWLDWEVG